MKVVKQAGKLYLRKRVSKAMYGAGVSDCSVCVFDGTAQCPAMPCYAPDDSERGYYFVEIREVKV